MTEEEKIDKTLDKITLAGVLIGAFAVTPFVLMFVWNTLVIYFVPVITIGYGGAWALNIIKTSILNGYSYQERTSEENFKGMLNSYISLAITVIATLIIGLSIGTI